jgi:hypothetical protein
MRQNDIASTAAVIVSANIRPNVVQHGTKELRKLDNLHSQEAEAADDSTQDQV